MTPRRIVRAVPTAGTTEDVGGLSYTDPVEGGNEFVFETFHEHGFPANLVKIARQVTNSDAGKLYPYDGATPVLPSDHGATNGGTTLKVQADILQSLHATLPPAGLLLQMTTGAAAGRTRRIVSNSTQTLTLNRAWATAEGIPATGDTYRLLYDLRQAKHLGVKVEYSANNAVVTLLVLLYDIPFTQAGVARASRVKPDQSLEVANLAIQGETDETSYYHGQPIAVTTKGYYGAKVRLGGLTTGSVSLWLDAT